MIVMSNLCHVIAFILLICAVVIYVMSLNYSVTVFNFREWIPQYGRGF